MKVSGGQVRLLRKKQVQDTTGSSDHLLLYPSVPLRLDNSCIKMASAAIKQTLRLGMIPADGIGKEVLPVSDVQPLLLSIEGRHIG